MLFIGDAADMYNDGAMKGSAWIFTDNQAEDRASLVRLDQRLKQGKSRREEALEFAHEGEESKGLTPLDDFAARNQ